MGGRLHASGMNSPALCPPSRFAGAGLLIGLCAAFTLVACGGQPRPRRVVSTPSWSAEDQGQHDEALQAARAAIEKARTSRNLPDLVEARGHLRAAQKRARAKSGVPAEIKADLDALQAEIRAEEAALMANAIQVNKRVAGALAPPEPEPETDTEPEAGDGEGAAVGSRPPEEILLDWPVEDVVVTSPFGLRRGPLVNERDQLSNHDGTDLKAAQGSPINACAEGTVTYARDKGGYGLLITVDHGLGVSTHYGHLSDIKVLVGQKVKQGELIGLAGQTGRATGPHLHLMVTIGRRKLDPMNAIGRTVGDIAQKKR